MAGKSKQQKKKLAKTRKQLAEELRQKPKKVKKIVADQPTDVLGNNAEKVTTPEEQSYIEDTRKPEPEMTYPLCGKPSTDGKEHDECMDREVNIKPKPEGKVISGMGQDAPKPFDPKSIVANILKKKVD